MSMQHAKSPCCREQIYHYGNRRRQCAFCRRTWRIRRKKMGRKRIRAAPASAIHYLAGTLSLSAHRALHKNQSRWKTLHRILRSRDAFLARARWMSPPDDTPLIAIADAIWQWIDGVHYVLHIILLKPLGSNRAIICVPLLRKGNESSGWSPAFANLPPTWQKRIVALVCDGNSGLVSVAYQNKWLVQRCHVHLRRFLNNYLRTGPYSTRRMLAYETHALITTMLTCRDRMTVARGALRLREIYHATKSHGIRKVISGFIKHLREYRTYLECPQYDLPTTTNAVESLNSMIRDLQRRVRGLRSPTSFLKWIHALLLNKKTIVCNGHSSTKLT